MRRRRTRAGCRPERLEQFKDAGLLGGEPERAGQAEIDSGGSDGTRSGTVLDQRGDFLGGAEIGLVDDAGFAVDAGALDDVVVELFAFFLATRDAI